MLFLSLRALHLLTSLGIYVLLHVYLDNTAPLVAAVLLPLIACTAPIANAAVLHLPIQRRGGPFKLYSDRYNLVDLEALYGELERLDARFNQTTRKFKGNRIFRTARKGGTGGGGNGVDGLMGNIQMEGGWFARIGLGTPPQILEVDVDMLTADFYVLETTSKKGTEYAALFSKSFIKPTGPPPLPNCALPTDTLTFPNSKVSTDLKFPHCRPPKFSMQTLQPSGSILGLAPSPDLSQFSHTTSFLSQLINNTVIDKPIISITLIDSERGVLTLGGTADEAVEAAKHKAEDILAGLGDPDSKKEKGELFKRAKEATDKVNDDKVEPWRERWRWSNVQGAAVGWWQILLQGIWVSGAKILRNQPVVLDLSTPLILAPPPAARALYASIPGSIPLPESPFHLFPCLNPPTLHFEFGGWGFPAMRAWSAKGRTTDKGTVGGKFSLGRLRAGSGYCVGAVVEWDMQLGGDAEGDDGGTWVLGESWFDGMQAVFDFEEQSVGFRTL